MSNTALIRITITVCVLILVLLTIMPSYADSIYPMTTIVREINYKTDEVITEDCNGNIWVFYGVEDWDIDDICSMIMSDNNTDTIYDDIILMVMYGGYAGGL